MKQILLVICYFILTQTQGQTLSAEKKAEADSLSGIYNNPALSDSTRWLAFSNMTGIYAVSRPDTAIALCIYGINQLEKSKTDLSKAKNALCDLYSNLGVAYSKQEKPDEALPHFEKSYQLAKDNKLYNQWARACNNIGVMWRQKNNSAQAQAFFEEGVSLKEYLSDSSQSIELLSNLGALHTRRGDYNLALPLFQECLRLAENKEGGASLTASACNNLSALYRNMGEVDLALSYLYRSLKIREQLNDKKGLALGYNNAGVMLFDQGKLDSALHFYQKSLMLRQEIGDRKGSASVLGNIGMVYSMQADFAKAFTYFEMSEKIRFEFNDQSGLGTVYNSLGGMFSDVGDYEKSLHYYQKAYDLRTQLGEKQSIVTSLNNIGLSYKYKGDYVSARTYFEMALELGQTIGFKSGIAGSLTNLALVDRTDKNYRQALVNYERAVEIYTDIKSEIDILYTYQSIGQCYLALNMPDSTIEYVKSVAAKAAEKRVLNVLNFATGTLYQAYNMKNQLPEALSYLSLLLKTREFEMRNNYFTLPLNQKEFYITTMEEDFMFYHAFTVERYTEIASLADTCYNLVLRNKALTLKSSTLMRQVILESGDNELIHLYNQWLGIKQKITSDYGAGKNIDSLEGAANALEKELALKSLAFNDYKSVFDVTWHQVKNKLKKKQAAIEFIGYVPSTDFDKNIHYAALIVTPDCEHPVVVKLCSEAELKKVMLRSPGSDLNYIEKVYGKNNQLNTDLYQLIWQPIEPYLKGVKAVYYSPYGLLHKIAFPALATSTNTLLCDRYELNTTTSTLNLTGSTDLALEANNNFTLLGGVDYNTDSSSHNAWSYLPGTLEETNYLSELLEKNNFAVNYYQQKKADEHTFKRIAGNANFLHIATHGFFYPDPTQQLNELSEAEQGDIQFRGRSNYADLSFVMNKNPLMRSGLVMAGANGVWERSALDESEDGILTAMEVSSLDLRKTKLVVLSACETGLGDIRGSEGVFGLQRAFKMAGAQFIIMSLWQVPDKETAEFMKLFYENLIDLKSVREAFLTTQKIVRKKYDPYYWAAFQLIE